MHTPIHTHAYTQISCIKTCNGIYYRDVVEDIICHIKEDTLKKCLQVLVYHCLPDTILRGFQR